MHVTKLLASHLVHVVVAAAAVKTLFSSEMDSCFKYIYEVLLQTIRLTGYRNTLLE